MKQRRLRRRSVVETALVPETREEFDAAMQSRARTVVLTMEQIREWNLAIDVVVMSDASAADAIFGTDREFYETVLEEDAGESPPEDELEIDPGDLPLPPLGAGGGPAPGVAGTVGVEAAGG